MEYADFPMPSDYPDFPHHSQIAAYFDAYVDHFGLRDRITFETGVEKADRDPADGTWHVTLDTGEQRHYDALLVANGHHWDPRWPEPPFPGEFDGVEMHAHHYVDNADLTGKRVVVLGMGNSAMDIAVEASLVAERTILAARRGAHVVPKYILGKPLDATPLSPRIPWRVRRRIGELLLKIAAGDVERYGLPKPDHRFGEAHPTVSSDILSRLFHGEIEVRPNIDRLEGDGVRFADGRVEQADVIIYCTGYKVTFPFFEPDLIAAPDNDLPLFRRVFHPDIPNVFFIGLLQPLGAIMPLAEAQGEWVAEYLRGAYALPGRRALLRDMQRERERMFRRYVASKRHTMQVDFDDYLLALSRERRRGQQRAQRAGNRLSVPALARTEQEPAAA
jgi:cation diffusion facilitator CzcD-associated flavoprotein CzcO